MFFFRNQDFGTNRHHNDVWPDLPDGLGFQIEQTNVSDAHA
jgi:hypothetical protein